MAEVDIEAGPNGPGAGAVLAAAIGWFALGVLALIGDAAPRAGALLTFWKPTGPLSGVTTGAIVIWLLAWAFLSRLWRGRNIRLAGVGLASAALIVGGALLTFPPFMDFLEGK